MATTFAIGPACPLVRTFQAKLTSVDSVWSTYVEYEAKPGKSLKFHIQADVYYL